MEAQVEGRREDALVPALDRVAQPLDVRVGDLALGRRDAAALRVEHARRLQLDEAAREPAHDLARVERLQVEAQVQRLAGIAQSSEPVRVDVPRVLREGQHSRALPVDEQLRATLLDRHRGDEIDGGAPARCERLGCLPRGARDTPRSEGE